MKRTRKNALQLVTTRLFKVDVDTVKRIADSNGIGWQVELRQILRRALVDQREVMTLKEQK